MISVDNMTPIRCWQFDSDESVNIDDIKIYLNNIITSIEEPFYIADTVIDGEGLGEKELKCIYIGSVSSSKYMPVYTMTAMGENGPVVLMGVFGKGEQMNSADLYQYYLETRATWANIYDRYKEMKFTVNRINSKFGNTGAAASVVTGASFLAGKAISGGVKLAVKGVKALTRDKEAYEKELNFYLNVMALGDYAFTEKGAKEYFDRIRNGAEKGIVIAQYLLGTRYYDGIGVEKDKETGIYWFERAASQGQADSREVLAFEYFFGEGEYSENQKNNGLVYLNELISQGNADAVGAMIEICTNASKYGVGLSPVDRINFLADAADNGFISAAYNLAIIYDSQEPCDPEFAPFADDGKACHLYETLLSADGDYKTEEIAYRLGCMYKNEVGVSRNAEKACHYFEEANRRGNIEAKVNLLQLYAVEPSTRDFSKAKKICKELLRIKDARLESISYYYNFVIADAEEKYKDSMAYANRYIESAAGDNEKKEELKKYIQEKDELLSNMTEEERRAYLKERKKLSDIIKGFKGVDLDVKDKKKIAIIAAAVLLIVLVVVIVIKNPFEKSVSPYTDNKSIGNSSATSKEAMTAYNSLLSQESFIRDETDDAYTQTWYSENCLFDIAYLNDDDVPELIIVDYADADETTGWGQVYSYYNGDIIPVEIMCDPEGSKDYGFVSGYYEKTGYITDISVWQGSGAYLISSLSDKNADTMMIEFESNEEFEPQIVGYSIGGSTVSEEDFYQSLEKATQGDDITPFDFCENTSDNRLDKLGNFSEVDNAEEDSGSSGIYGVAFDYVGKTFGNLNDEYGPLEQQASWNGAIYYTTSDGRYLGFQAGWNEDGDLEEGADELCISYMGSISDILNVPEDATLQEVADLLGEDLNTEDLNYEPYSDMGNCVIWYIEYNDQEYKLIINYDENIDITGANLVGPN